MQTYYISKNVWFITDEENKTTNLAFDARDLDKKRRDYVTVSLRNFKGAKELKLRQVDKNNDCFYTEKEDSPIASFCGAGIKKAFKKIPKTIYFKFHKNAKKMESKSKVVSR